MSITVKNTILFLTFSISLSFSIYSFVRTPRIAYVHNGVLFTKFKGAEESNKQLQLDMSNLKSNIDTLTYSFRQEVLKYQKEQASLNTTQKNAAREYLGKRENDLLQYKQQSEARLKEQEAKLNEAIIGQMNTYIEEYGKDNGYDYILGVTENGSIMYSGKAHDITEEVLAYMNKKYNGK